MKANTWVPIGLLALALVIVAPAAVAGESPLPSYERPAKSGQNEDRVSRPKHVAAASLGQPVTTESFSEGTLETYEVEGSAVLIFWPTDSDFCVPGEVYNTSPPALSGTAAVGGTLSVSNGSWFICQAYPSYAYRWSTGASGQSYTVQSQDAGTTITATVTNCTRLPDGTAGDCASAASNAVTIAASPPPPPPPPPTPAPVVAFNPSGITVNSGATTTFGWSASNASSCQASGGDVAWPGGRATSGSYTTRPLTASTTYTLQCSGPGGVGTGNVVVTVIGSQPTVTLTATPQEVSGGGSVTLTWSSTNASAGCTATSNPVFGSWSGVKAGAGSQAVGPIFQASSFTLSCESSTGGRDTKTATVTVLGAPPPPPNPPYLAPFGALDRVDSAIGSFEGWACDPDDYNRGISVEFYRDGAAGQGGVYLGSAVAANALPGSSIGSQCGGTTAHSFRAIFQSLLDGKPHTIYAYAVNIGTAGPNVLLLGTPRSFPGGSDPVGALEPVDGTNGRVSGWACDADDVAAALQVHLWLDGPAGNGGTFLGSTSAGRVRGDVSSFCGGTTAHGFDYVLPDSLRDGRQHTLYAYARNVGGGADALLRGSATAFILDPYPGGWFYEDDPPLERTFLGTGNSMCKAVLYRKTARSFIFRTVIFRANIDTRWCWRGDRITEASAVCYASDVSYAIQADSCPTPQGQYFSTPYDNRGGWHALSQQTFRNCLPGPLGSWTCWRQATITLHFYARAQGWWSASGGDG